MLQVHMLTRHRDIQDWVSDNRGTPAIARIRDRLGREKALLKLRFDHKRDSELDSGMSPCSWTAWFAELDRQQLALMVEPNGAFELVPRARMN